MKNLIIALMALTITLGVSCKKENAQPGNDSQKQKEVVLKVEKGVSVVDPNNPPENGGGQGSFPHNTGVCNCGRYAVCHPYYVMVPYYTPSGMIGYSLNEYIPGVTYPRGSTYSPRYE